MAYPRANWRIQGRMPAAPGTRFAGALRQPAATAAASGRMGTWKLAYADFLTALAAFFLVMWLVKGMPDEGRADIAGYFETGEIASATQVEPDSPDPRALLLTAIERAPTFMAHKDHLELAYAVQGLRIDLMDRSDAPLFSLGAAEPTEAGAQIMGDVFASLAALPYAISLEGHTDAFPVRTGTASNWTLSADRADQARQIAEAAGIAPGRFQAITGYGDRRPRLPAEPHHPTNRRVTVILHVPSNDSIAVGS